MIDASDFEKLGNEMTSGKKLSERKASLKFKAMFGASPQVCAEIWSMLVPLNNSSAPKHLLWALMLLKVYSSEMVLCSIAKTSEKTFSKWTWIFIQAIANLSFDIVSHGAFVLIVIYRFAISTYHYQLHFYWI